jgi:hypothetical protein
MAPRPVPTLTARVSHPATAKPMPATHVSIKNDAALVRSVARALSDPAVETETRVLLRERFGVAKTKGLKEFLASAPLDGLDLTRKRDVGRKVEL